MIDTVLFDLDDTLVSEYAFVRSGYRHVAALLAQRLGLAADEIFAELTALLRESPDRVFNRLLRAHGAADDAAAVLPLVHAYRTHRPALSLYPDVLPALHRLRAAGLGLGIITDGPADMQQNKLDAVGADRLFDHILLTDRLGPGCSKPHPAAFERMREAFGTAFDRMVYVGDNPRKDFYIAKLLPIRTVRVLRRPAVYADAAYLEGVREQAAIASLTELWDTVAAMDAGAQPDKQGGKR